VEGGRGKGTEVTPRRATRVGLALLLLLALAFGASATVRMDPDTGRPVTVMEWREPR